MNESEYAADGGVAAVTGTVDEWYDATQKAGLDVSRRTVRRALNDLHDAELVAEGDYVQHRGRLHTITQFGAQTAKR